MAEENLIAYTQRKQPAHLKAQELEQTSSDYLAASVLEGAGPSRLVLCAGADWPSPDTPSGAFEADAGWIAAQRPAGQCWPWLAAGAG